MMSFINKMFLTKSVTEKVNKNRSYSFEDYDETYEILKRVLRVVGLRLNCKDSEFARFWYIAFYWFEFANVLVVFILDTIEVIRTTKEGTFEDAIMIFRMLPCMGYLLMAILKSYKIICNRFVYENLIMELRSMWPQGMVSVEEDQILSKALTRLKIVVYGYYWCNFFLFVSFIAPPYFAIIQRALGHDVPRYLPFFYWFPFDPLRPFVYEFVLIFQTWHTILAIWLMLCGDLLFCIFINHITTQFDLLSIRINRLVLVPTDDQLIGEYPLANNYKRYKNEYGHKPGYIKIKYCEAIHHKELREILVRHHNLIRLSEDVEKLFSFALLINFFNSSIIICFCNFCSIMVEKLYEFMYKSFLITALSQTWLLCWFGQLLLDSSEGVTEALYNCGWYLASNKIKRSIQIMILRSQKNVFVTTYGFTIICLASYTAIIKTSWSYFTLLINTYKQ